MYSSIIVILLAYYCNLICSFNVQDIEDGKVINSSYKGQLFGASLSFHENEAGKWLIVGAPKESTRAEGSNWANAESEYGNLYKCPLGNNVRKFNCTKLEPEIIQKNDLLYSCDFESSVLKDTLVDDFNWIRINGSTPSKETGPSSDHTTENSSSVISGYYLYMEASRTKYVDVKAGYSAIVETSKQKSTVGDCLRFWYHMYGDHVASLNVYVQSNESGMLMIWNKDGAQGNKWIEGHATVISEFPYKILFEGIRENWRGDIAIDDITLHRGQCKEDIVGIEKSVITTMSRNPETGEMLLCSPSWKYNCSGLIHVSGACYLLNKNLTTDNIAIMTPARKQVCLSAQVDLVFIIDSSESVTNSDFEYLKLWLRNIISTFPIGLDSIQVGVMTYRKTPSVSFHLNKYHKVEDLRRAVEDMQYTGGSTHTGKAIDEAAANMFHVENGMRPTAKHVAIVMTDGKSQDDVREPVGKAKQKGITFFAIGIGDAQVSELLIITSDPGRYLFQIEDYAALSKIKQSLQKSIATLERQDKTPSTQQGQAGFCATFYQNVSVIGIPGLDDWSGGYSSYFIDKTTRNPKLRIITTFRNLLKNVADTSLYNEAEFNEDKIISENRNDISPTIIDITTFSPLFNYNENRSIGDDSTTDSSSKNNTIRSSTNVNFLPTMQTTRINTSTTYFIESSGNSDILLHKGTTKAYKSQNSNDKTYFEATSTNTNQYSNASVYINKTSFIKVKNEKNHIRDDILSLSNLASDATLVTLDLQNESTEIVPKTQSSRASELKSSRKTTPALNSLAGLILNDNLADELQSYAYFGYSMATGRFLDQNRIDIAIGSPRALSVGAVFIVRQDSFPSDSKHQNTRLMSRYDSGQMGSYFGFSICAADLDGDGFDDVIIGAPLWMGNHGDEGRVFVYLSNSIDVKNKIILRGRQMKNARFGFSLATPGDLNKDGYGDFIVGAPSSYSSGNGEGSVFIYYGRPDIGVSLEYVQVIKATKRATSLIYFGYSVDATQDVDGNGYNDVAVGAPGSDKVMLLLSAPVVYINATLSVIPPLLNIMDENVTSQYFCDGNAAKLCIIVNACFTAYGHRIPDEINLTYRIFSDTEMKERNRRGFFSSTSGDIKLLLNKQACEQFNLRIKLPVRYQLTPFVILLKYELANEQFHFALPPLLDVFNAKQVSTKIDFAKMCENVSCQSDLKVSCSIANELFSAEPTTIIIAHKQQIIINLNVTNQKNLAHDVVMDIIFHHSLYLIQALSFDSQGRRCANRDQSIKSPVGISDNTSLSESEDWSPNENFQLEKLFMKNPKMKENDSCAFRLQFGFFDTFEGGHLNFAFDSTTNSKEFDQANNRCDLMIDVKFQADLSFQGKSNDEQIAFWSSNISGISNKDDGPTFTQSYSLKNHGPSTLPKAVMKVWWPAFISSTHRILSLLKATCIPPESCWCDPVPSFSTTESNTTKEKFSKNSDQQLVEPDAFVQSEPKLDENTRETFHKVALQCSIPGSDLICERLLCQLETIQQSSDVTLLLEFRLWKETFIQGKVWQAVVRTDAEAFIDQSSHIIGPHGKARVTNFSAKAITKAFNKDFKFAVQEKPRNNRWWIIAVSVAIGFATLLAIIFLLYKLGFFRSKYKQQIQELEWNYSSCHIAVPQEQSLKDGNKK